MTLKRFLAREGLSLAFLIAVMVFLRTTVFGLYPLSSHTMRPTLLPGDTVLVNRLAYGLHLPFRQGPVVQWATPARGDVVVFSGFSGDGILVKRVVATGGERVEIRQGRLFVEGLPVEEAELTDESLYARHEVSPGHTRLAWESPRGSTPHLVQRALSPERALEQSREFLVPPGRLFCMGDNREDTPENRFWGFLEPQQVLGRVERVAFSRRAEDDSGVFTGTRWWRTLLAVP